MGFVAVLSTGLSNILLLHVLTLKVVATEAVVVVIVVQQYFWNTHEF